jgi:hypothetical protein
MESDSTQNEDPCAVPTNSDVRLHLPEILHRFVDQYGILLQWPRKRPVREAILAYLADKFRRNHLYSETEVNELLLRWHTFHDPALLRRELYDNGYLGRTSSGDRYWRER